MRVTDVLFKDSKNKRLVKPIYLYSILYDIGSNTYLRYTSRSSQVTFDGITYLPYVIKHDSITEDLSGNTNRIQLTIGNVNRYIQSVNDQYGLVGKEVSIKTVFEECLTNPQAFISDTYEVYSVDCNKTIATLSLRSAYDVRDTRLPKRHFFRGYCEFRFKGLGCQYAGTETTCTKRLQRCRVIGNVTHIGSFPAIPMSNMLIK